MRSLSPVLLFALAGLLAGGVWSLQRQGGSRSLLLVLAALALLAAGGGVLWLIPGAR